MKRFLRVGAFFGLGMLVFCGCNKDSDGEVNSGPSALDTELVGLIDLNSNGAGTAYFRLPASTDFSNIPQDPNNPLTAAKVELGKLLFHETGTARNPRLFTSSNEYSCASCHHAAAGFQAGMAQGIGEGGMGFGFIGEGRTISPGYFDNPIWKDSVDVQPIRTPTALNVAYQANMLWNGQFGATGVNVGTENAWTAGTPKAFNHLGFEGIETQAIAGQTVHRQLIDYGFCEDYSDYMGLFKAAFGSVPESIDEMRINSGLAIAAYERTLLATEAPFQKWLKGSLNVLSDSEKLGAVVFFGKGNCVSCHTGPALNSMEFHAYGMKDLHEIASAHNANPNNVENKGRGGFTGHPDDMYKFKVPQLYNLREVGFLGHGASFNTVFDVVRYKNEGVAQNQVVPTGQLADDFQPLLLSEAEVNDLVNFLENSLFDPHLDRYAPEALPSGMCFPNADAQSMVDTGCSE